MLLLHNNPPTVHTARILRFPLDHCGQILYCANNGGGQQANGRGDRPLSPPRDKKRGAVAVILGGRLSYGCIYKTHFFPIMLFSI